MAPSWKLGEVSREAAEDVVNSVQPPQDGTFAIRERGIGHVLCVVYRGRPTHHLIEKVDGQFSINKKTYGNTASTLEELVEYFKKPQTGWPVLLREPPQKIGDTSEKVDPRKRSSSMSASMKNPKWLHDPMGNKEAQAMLLREEAVDGRFVLRKRGPEHPDDYVLSLIFKSKCTHHLITKGSDGFLRVNGKSYGEIPNVKEFVLAVSSTDVPDKWPVRLSEYVAKDGTYITMKMRRRSSNTSIRGTPSPMRSKPTGTAREEHPVPEDAEIETVGTHSEDKPIAWLHPPMSNPEASELLGNSADGTFLVRNYAGNDQFVISVRFRGRPTHHLTIAPTNAPSTVNKQSTGVVGIVSTIALLRSVQKFWPVPLKNHVPVGQHANPKPDASVESSSVSATHRHAEQQRENAEKQRRLEEAKVAEVAARQRKDEEERQRTVARVAAEAEERQRVEQQVLAAKKVAEETEEQRVLAEERAAAEAAAEEARRKAHEEEEARRRAEEEEDNRVTGFFELDDPFPAGEEVDSSADDYVRVGPGATALLQQARQLARESAQGTAAGTLKLMGLPAGDESYTDGEHSATTAWSGSGRGLAGYVPGSGYAGTAAGAQKMNELEQRLAVADARDAANDTRLEKLEEMVQKLIELSTVPEELKSLRSKNTQLEKKMALIEHLLLQTSATQNGGDNDTFTTVEVRLITKPAGHVRGAKPKQADVLKAELVGKIRALKNSTYATVRNQINEDFDDGHCPPDYRFYMVDDHADELTVVHAKQESKMEVDGASVYIFVPHRVQSGEDRGPGLPLNSTVGLNNSTVGSNNSTVGSNYVPKVRLNKFNDGSWIKH